MSWLTDAYDFVSGAVGGQPFGDSTGSFLTKNKNWLQPVAQAGVSLFNNSQKGNAESQYIDYLKQREDKNYQNSLDAYNAQVAASQANASASAANSAARAGAANATEANRQKALAESNKQQQKTYAELIKMYKPFTDSAMQILPQKQRAFEDSLKMQGMLQAYLNTPQELAKMNQAQPAYNINVPLPPGLNK